MERLRAFDFSGIDYFTYEWYLYSPPISADIIYEYAR